MARIVAVAALLCLLAAGAPPQGGAARVAFQEAASRMVADHTAAIDRLVVQHNAVMSEREAVRLHTIKALYDSVLDKQAPGLAGRLVQCPVSLEHWVTSYGTRHPGATPDWRTDTEKTGARLTPQGVVLTNAEDDYMEWAHEAVLSDLTPFVAKIRLVAPGGAKVGIQNRGTSAMFFDVPPRLWTDIVIKREGPLDEVTFYFNGTEVEMKQSTSIADRLTIQFGRNLSVYVAQVEFWIWQSSAR